MPFQITPAVRGLLIAMSIVLALVLLRQDAIIEMLLLKPLQAGFMPWQVVTYALVDSSIGLFVNGLILVMFGAQMEYSWGTRRFLTYVVNCVAGAGVVYLLATLLLPPMGPVGPAYGFTPAIMGLLLAFVIRDPNATIMLIIPPIPMKARTLFIVIVVLQVVFGWSAGPVVVLSNLSGAVFGWLTLRYWQGKPPFPPKRPRGPRLVK